MIFFIMIMSFIDVFDDHEMLWVWRRRPFQPPRFCGGGEAHRRDKPVCAEYDHSYFCVFQEIRWRWPFTQSIMIFYSWYLSYFGCYWCLKWEEEMIISDHLQHEHKWHPLIIGFEGDIVRPRLISSKFSMIQIQFQTSPHAKHHKLIACQAIVSFTNPLAASEAGNLSSQAIALIKFGDFSST